MLEGVRMLYFMWSLDQTACISLTMQHGQSVQISLSFFFPWVFQWFSNFCYTLIYPVEFHHLFCMALISFNVLKLLWEYLQTIFWTSGICHFFLQNYISIVLYLLQKGLNCVLYKLSDKSIGQSTDINTFVLNRSSLTFTPDKNIPIGVPSQNISTVRYCQAKDILRFVIFLWKQALGKASK